MSLCAPAGVSIVRVSEAVRSYGPWYVGRPIMMPHIYMTLASLTGVALLSYSESRERGYPRSAIPVLGRITLASRLATLCNLPANRKIEITQDCNHPVCGDFNLVSKTTLSSGSLKMEGETHNHDHTYRTVRTVPKSTNYHYLRGLTLGLPQYSVICIFEIVSKYPVRAVKNAAMQE
eukprot:372388-Pleurochrysis_carterae.AAC.1